MGVPGCGGPCNEIFCFFFQAEDGIRDKLVTGVQTCALPISVLYPRLPPATVLLRMGSVGMSSNSKNENRGSDLNEGFCGKVRRDHRRRHGHGPRDRKSVCRERV